MRSAPVQKRPRPYVERWPKVFFALAALTVCGLVLGHASGSHDLGASADAVVQGAGVTPTRFNLQLGRLGASAGSGVGAVTPLSVGTAATIEVERNLTPRSRVRSSAQVGAW